MSATADRWAAPSEVDDAAMVFGSGALAFMPTLEEAEAGLREMPRETARMWRDFQQTWFFDGLPQGVTVTLAEGVDGEAAWRHLRMIQGSFDPKHEHKEAAVAWLASRWFTSVKNYRKASG